MEEFNHWALVYHELDKCLKKTVSKVAHDIERGAKQRAPVDTGALRASIYTRTEDTSDYSKAGVAAWKKNAGASQFPEVPQPLHNEAVVAVGMSYGIYVEYGTHNHPAHPYLVPAADAEREKFARALRQAIEEV